ncbi:unnamed protein product [Arctogadus glacialis]
MKDDRYDYFQFIQEVSAKFNLPNESDVDLKDSSGVDVDADIFDELVRSAAVSFKVFTGDSAEKEVSEASFCSEEGSFSPIESVRSFSSVESMVYVALHQKTGGEDIFKEYNATKGLSDQTRRKLVNILVSDMVESHGRVPPINVRVTYALGIVTLFPNLKDKASPTGYEHYYDPHSGQGYLAYRLKTVQRNTTSDFKRSPKSADQHGPKTLRETSTSEQLSGDECREAMSVMKHSADQPVVKEKMKATFKHRQSMLHDPDQSSVILDHFPRFLDTPGLVRIIETCLMYQLLNVLCTMF